MLWFRIRGRAGGGACQAVIQQTHRLHRMLMRFIDYKKHIMY